MSTQDTLTDEALAGDAQLTSADGAAADVSDALTLADLKAALGKDFKDKDSALKALKETQNFVGKRKEDIAAELAQTQQAAPQSADTVSKSELQALQKELFYTQNPQYKDYRALIDSMGNPAEVVQSDVFKGIFEKVKAADEEAQKKSVLTSSPRLAQTKSITDEAVKLANSTAGNSDVAEFLAKGIVEEIQG